MVYFYFFAPLWSNLTPPLPASMSNSSPLCGERHVARLCGASQVWPRTPSIHPSHHRKAVVAPLAASSSMLIAMRGLSHLRRDGREVSGAEGGDGLWEKRGTAAGGVNKLLSYQPARSRAAHDTRSLFARRERLTHARKHTEAVLTANTAIFPGCFHMLALEFAGVVRWRMAAWRAPLSKAATSVTKAASQWFFLSVSQIVRIRILGISTQKKNKIFFYSSPLQIHSQPAKVTEIHLVFMDKRRFVLCYSSVTLSLTSDCFFSVPVEKLWPQGFWWGEKSIYYPRVKLV